MALRQIIIDKLIELIGITNKQEIEGIDAQQVLSYIFNFYQEESQFLRAELTKLVQINADFKLKEVQLDQRYQQLQLNFNYQVSQQITNARSTANFTQQEIQNQRQIAQEWENKFKHSVTYIAELQDKLRTQDIKMASMENQHAQELEKAKRTLLVELDRRLRASEQTMRKIRDTEINAIQKQRKIWHQQVKEVVDTVNEMLEINSAGSHDISKWMKQFKAQITKYKKEIESFSFERENSKPMSCVIKLANRQKERLASRRMYLIKTVIDKSQ